jgi:hypothetical protein
MKRFGTKAAQGSSLPTSIERTVVAATKKEAAVLLGVSTEVVYFVSKA